MSWQMKKIDVDVQLKYSKSEVKGLLKQHVKNRWQKQPEEEETTGRWFYSIHRVVDKHVSGAQKQS